MLARPLLALALAAGLAGPALAQTADEAPVSTAANKTPASGQTLTAPAVPAPSAPSRPMTTDEQIAAYLATSPALTPESDGPVGVTAASAAEQPKRQIHGAMGATIGTGGYRSGYVSTLIPLGETGTLGIAVEQTDFGDNVVYGRGYGRGYGHGLGGYGGYGDGLWAGRGGRRSSVAVSLALGGGDRDAVPQGCAPGGFRGTDGRYVEPLWVTRMRGDDHLCDSLLGR